MDGRARAQAREPGQQRARDAEGEERDRDDEPGAVMPLRNGEESEQADLVREERCAHEEDRNGHFSSLSAPVNGTKETG
jgi:hypothetical protein